MDGIRAGLERFEAFEGAWKWVWVALMWFLSTETLPSLLNHYRCRSRHYSIKNGRTRSCHELD